MPSVRSTTLIEDLGGSALPPATRPISAVVSRRPSRLKVSEVTCALAYPGRLEFRAVGDDHQYRQPPHALGDPLQQFERG